MKKNKVSIVVLLIFSAAVLIFTNAVTYMMPGLLFCGYKSGVSGYKMVVIGNDDNLILRMRP